MMGSSTKKEKEDHLRFNNTLIQTGTENCSLYLNYSFPCCVPEYEYCAFGGDQSNCDKYLELIEKAIEKQECYACKYWISPSTEKKCKLCDEQSNFEPLIRNIKN